MGLLDVEKLSRETTEMIVPRFSNVSRNMKELSDRLNLVGETISSTEMENIIYSSYYMFLDESFLRDRASREAMINVFTNQMFLRSFINIVSQQRIVLNPVHIICCNKVTWDAVFTNINIETKELLLQLSNEVNRWYILSLSSHIDIHNASLIALAANSSFDKRKCVKRVNRILASIQDITAQKIVDVYSVLFNSSLTLLFESTMFDTTEIKSEDQHRWNLIFFALMTIMENVDSNTIETVLKSYAETFVLEGRPPVRFFLQTTKVNFPRVGRVMDALLMENILVP